MKKSDILRAINFGQRVAEDETDLLETYFVETDDWGRLYRGDIDIIYGPKGSGKSALYSLLLARTSELFDRNILLIAAENPRGATAFHGLVTAPPVGEIEFVGLWKLYFATVLHASLAEYSISNPASNELREALEREGLAKTGLTLAKILGTVGDYVRRALRPQALEGGVTVDPTTQLPVGFTGKIIFAEPARQQDSEFRSVDTLLELANRAFSGAGVTAWLLLDRLDVAFAENDELECNALRALFRVYLDLQTYQNLRLKIFLRTDIWNRITTSGFREASHITRALTINWNQNSLLNLVVRRMLHNPDLRNAFSVHEELSRHSIVDQKTFFYRVFPNQVDVGPNKPNTFDWLLSRTRDGSKFNAPRELVHILNALRDVQVRRLEVGEQEPVEELLFSRPSFKDALPEVSRVRLEQTLYAEYPSAKPWIEKLKGAKTLQTRETLSDIWGVSQDEAGTKADELAAIGFFEARGNRKGTEYWVPFLYRDALDLVQGAEQENIQ